MQSLVNMWDGVLESSYYNATENKNTFFFFFFFFKYCTLDFKIYSNKDQSRTWFGWLFVKCILKLFLISRKFSIFKSETEDMISRQVHLVLPDYAIKKKNVALLLPDRPTKIASTPKHVIRFFSLKIKEPPSA